MTATAVGAQPLDSIVAVVNEDVIVNTELENEINAVLPDLQAQGTAIPSREVLAEQVLERIISQRLQMQRAKKLGIEADDETLTDAMNNIASRNGMTLEQLQVTLEQSNMSFDKFRNETRDQIISGRLRQQAVIQKIRVTDVEAERFLETEADSLLNRQEVRLQHILIALPDNPTSAQVTEGKARINELTKRLRRGADFGSLAVAHSDGRRALEGGDLGWFPIAEVPTLAVEPAQELGKGEVSAPLRSASGFHLIKVTEIKGDAPKAVTQTNARHILLRSSELESDDDAKLRLEQLRMRLVGGDNFATLARAHSDDTGSALKGGDLGWVNPGDTVPQFEEVMDKLQPNEISKPFKSPFGWHVVQVLERRDQETNDELMLMKAKDAIRARKAEEATELWLRQLRDEAYVEIRLPGGEDY